MKANQYILENALIYLGVASNMLESSQFSLSCADGEYPGLQNAINERMSVLQRSLDGISEKMIRYADKNGYNKEEAMNIYRTSAASDFREMLGIAADKLQKSGINLYPSLFAEHKGEKDVSKT